jgi:hypothetical protein
VKARKPLAEDERDGIQLAIHLYYPALTGWRAWVGRLSVRPAVLLFIGLVLLTLPLIAACGASPTAPCTDQYGRGETGLNELKVSCATVGSQLQCQSIADIAGLYVYCPMQQDVTQAASWTIADSTIGRVTAPGVFQALAPGHSVIHATWNGLDSMNFGSIPIAVFPGTAPMPTGEISGTVSEAGQSLLVPIGGAVVQVLDGLVAGQTATSGVPPPILPGYFGPIAGASYYRILGVPPGTYHVRITKDGYISQDRIVTIGNVGSPAVDFQLVKS